MTTNGHKHSASLTVNQKAQLTTAYNELGKELSSNKIRMIGNYTLGKVIGEGSFGTVRMGTHRLTSTRVAVKQIPKAMSAQLTREIHHHRRLHHPHVVQLYEIIATENYIWLVTELCSGGELYDYLVEKGRLSEEETRIIFGQLCLAVGYIHEKGVVHRDLKLENVLLDERCRVKLSDFGFTREYERGWFLETWCGTTGYVAPEILLNQKYLGHEVDIWSLGVILYTLLTGMLPFDDDDEIIQREKIIHSEYEDPEWLSPEARDLLRKILQKEPTKRLGIAQIFKHPFFTNQRLGPSAASTRSAPLAEAEEPKDDQRSWLIGTTHSSVPSEYSDSTATSYHSTFSELSQSIPTTPESESPVEGILLHHSNQSGSTITKPAMKDDLSTPVRRSRPPSNEFLSPVELTPVRSNGSTSSFNSKAPPNYPGRTPARTKRRSNGSTLSLPSPTTPTFPNPPPVQDFSSSLSNSAPIVFSTPLERDLLNNLSALGFDTGQMVHSVLTDACDCSGALWWMMRKKAERRVIEDPSWPKDARKDGLLTAPNNHRTSLALSESSDSGLNTQQPPTPVETPLSPPPPPLPEKPSPPNVGVVPPTPTLLDTSHPRTPSPPTVLSPTLLSANTPPSRERSNSVTPTNKGRGTKPRSASVSIMQRAVLGAAGLVRKKSEERVRVREEQEKEKERERREKEEKERRAASAEEARLSSHKLTKSPPTKPVKDGLPSAPSPIFMEVSGLPSGSSQWTMPVNSASGSPPAAPPTPANTPGDSFVSLPNSDSVGSAATKQRTRASLLHAFRMWFHEDRKGKRKAAAAALRPVSPPPSASSSRGGRSKRRSGSNSGPPRRPGHQKRLSASSRRSSSVNSRRSSVTSIQKVPGLEHAQPFTANEELFNPRRRSFGTKTPTSERGDYPSRPESVRSLRVSTPGVTTGRRPHSPSESSTGSGRRSIRRTESPLQRYHRRAGSGSSTRVIRQIKTVHVTHVRSNSVSSNHSARSSRPGSYHEGSEAEGRSSPFLPMANDETPRRVPYSTTVLVAHKKHTPFRQPSLSRSSWKRAWGVEPPGWKSRSTEAPFEILFTEDPRTNVRDVFSNRPSLTQDDDEWVDEDDDFVYVGGLGQVASPPTNSASQAMTFSKLNEAFIKPEPLILSPPPGRNARSQGKRNANRSAARQKGAHSPVSGPGSVPVVVEHPQADSRTSRRQPRAEPAFELPIQEEDEDEE